MVIIYGKEVPVRQLVMKLYRSPQMHIPTELSHLPFKGSQKNGTPIKERMRHSIYCIRVHDHYTVCVAILAKKGRDHFIEVICNTTTSLLHSSTTGPCYNIGISFPSLVPINTKVNTSFLCRITD